MVYKNAPLVCSNGAYDGSENRTRFCYLAAFNPRITAEENPAASISFSPQKAATGICRKPPP